MNMNSCIRKLHSTSQSEINEPNKKPKLHNREKHVIVSNWLVVLK